MSSGEEHRLDVRERGASQHSDRRLFVQLQAFGGCLDAKPLVRALEGTGLDAVLYQDVNDPRGVGILGMHEDAAFFAGPFRELLNTGAFGDLLLKPELTMFGRTYASGFETELEDWLLQRPRRTVLNPSVPLFREARYLLADEPDLRDTALYHSVLAAIASGNTTRGGIARVEMEVATTFAVSWNPFVKSKISAVATTITTMISLPI